MTSLKEQWKEAKRNETLWTQRRIEIESQMYDQHRNEIPEKGTYTAEDGIKITTGFTEDWDQEGVTAAYQQWPADVKFPFIGTWKPDGKAISYLRDNMPEMYRMLQPSLTLKPRKPSFSVKE